ncbi:MAG: LytTR family DNA-binding domain-containing protein, partial [Mesorhizobium sp.]|nr:LytTR family DNA-binding domain-containing protein [Mesorhizobium sp.]
MNDGPWHFTMRELQRMFFAPRLWAALAGVAVLTGLVGPFGTYDELRLPARLAYWAAIVVPTWFAGVGTTYVLSKILSPRRQPGRLAYAAFGALAGLPVAATVYVVNLIAFENLAVIPFRPLLLYCAAISAVVSWLVAMASSQSVAAPAAPGATEIPAAPPRPRILDRLPPHLRAPLSHMSMQDHYVDIHTDRGGALVLMRLADAISEADGVAGLRIHRSHWVATGAVAATLRRDGRVLLRMKDGTELPVSRS